MKYEKIIFCDIETRSRQSLPTVGGSRYAEDCEICLFAYALNDENARVWDIAAGEKMPAELRAALNDPEVYAAWHNGFLFDLPVLAACRGLEIPLNRVLDTMGIAYMHALPGALRDLCEVLQIPPELSKLHEGRKNMLLFCKPCRDGKFADFRSHPMQWEEYKKYAINDVIAMRECWKRMPKWNLQPHWLAAYRMHEAQNRRGIQLDLDLARAAVAALESDQNRLRGEMQEFSKGEIDSAQARQQIIDYLENSLDFRLPRKKVKNAEGGYDEKIDLSGAAVDKLLDAGVPPRIAEILQNRREANRNSTAKFKKFLAIACEGDLLKGFSQFSGARTGRVTGREGQPYNLPRTSWSVEKCAEGRALLKSDLAELHESGALELCKNLTRNLLISRPGHTLHVSDWKNIEGRLVAWAAGDEAALAYFRKFDEGDAPDAYKNEYAKTFGIPVESVSKDQRQIGKAISLAFGYAGAFAAFANFAQIYRVDLQALAEAGPRFLPPDLLAEKRDYVRTFVIPMKLHRAGLSDEQIAVFDSIKELWRRAHPEIVRLWWELEDAAIRAIQLGSPHSAGGAEFDRKGNWLRMRLPCGRFLQYPGAQVEDIAPRKQKFGRFDWRETGLYKGRISYMGKDALNPHWHRIGTSGGKLLENFTQALSASLLYHQLPKVDAQGFLPLFSTYDEIVSEAPDDSGLSHEILSEIMCESVPFLPNLPLAAEGFSAKIYRKDNE